MRPSCGLEARTRCAIASPARAVKAPASSLARRRGSLSISGLDNDYYLLDSLARLELLELAPCSQPFETLRLNIEQAASRGIRTPSPFITRSLAQFRSARPEAVACELCKRAAEWLSVVVVVVLLCSLAVLRRAKVAPTGRQAESRRQAGGSCQTGSRLPRVTFKFEIRRAPSASSKWPVGARRVHQADCSSVAMARKRSQRICINVLLAGYELPTSD